MAGTHPIVWDTETKVLYVKKQFYKSIKVYMLITLLPTNVTKKEIRELVSNILLSNIQIVEMPTFTSVKADIDNVEELEQTDWDKSFFFREKIVNVQLYNTKHLLCISKLPMNYTEEEFYNLVKPYGEIQSNYLMVSEITGDTKGYGFVQYKLLSDALSARSALNKVYIHNCKLNCGFLNNNVATFKSLHSKCLFVDCIPKNVSAANEFQKVFSFPADLIDCQVAIRNGCLEDWGIVEYSNWEDAELVARFLNGYHIQSQHIKISYCIPGEKAINVYRELMGNYKQTENPVGLLPEPTYEEALQRIDKLFYGNMDNKYNIIKIIANALESRVKERENLKKTALSNSKSQNNQLPLINTLSRGKGQNISSPNIMMPLCSNPIVVNPKFSLGHSNLSFPLASTPYHKRIITKTIYRSPIEQSFVSCTPNIFENRTIYSPTLNNQRNVFRHTAPPLISPLSNSMNRNQNLTNSFHNTRMHPYKKWVSTDSGLEKFPIAQTPMPSHCRKFTGDYYSFCQKQNDHNNGFLHPFYTNNNKPKTNPIGSWNNLQNNSKNSF